MLIAVDDSLSLQIMVHVAYFLEYSSVLIPHHSLADCF